MKVVPWVLCVLSLAPASMSTEPQAAAKPDPWAGYVAPADWLKKQPKPKFKQGHTLPPLTRYGWTLDFDTRVEFAEHWGYCLELGGGYLSEAVVERHLTDPNNPEAKILALAAKDPKTYKLAAICSREMPPNDKVPPETWARDAQGKLLSGQAKSQDGNTWTPGMEAVYSPATPDSVWQEASRLRAEPMRRLREKCPIAIVLNGGEYGLAVPGWGQKVWEKDPAIVKARGTRSWDEFASEGTGRLQTFIADAVRKAVPDRTLYIYYSVSGNAGPWTWAPGYPDMKRASDLPSTESYYMHFNSGWTGDKDQLTKFLQAKAYEIAGAQPLSYNWLCGGPTHVLASQYPTDIPTYTGFLKCCYTAGMIGGNAGYYEYPRYKSPPYPKAVGGFDAKFLPDQPPQWILQMMALARVHAEFSHLEPYLRQGDLLTGPEKHRWSKDQSAYEFSTGDVNARVLARKLRDKPQWLVTAWAADGKERKVTATIPDLGEVTLLARACGSVYEAALKGGKISLTPALGD